MLETLILVWDRLSYMVELIAACMLYLSVCRKKSGYPLRFAGGSAALLAFSWCVNSACTIPDAGPAMYIYWGVFLTVLIPFVRLCLDGPMTEVLYCVTCASATQHLVYDIRKICCGLSADILPEGPVQVLVFAAGYLLMHRIVVPRLVTDGRFHVSKEDVFPMSAILILVCGLTVLMPGTSPTREGLIIYTCCDTLCCVYLFWGQVHERQKLLLQRELDGVRYVWAQQQAQYQITQETIDVINRKCHDLRHQIREMYNTDNQEKRARYFEEIDRAVMIYDTAVQTGNPALDTVLMEKGLFCKSHQIDWTCMADGGRLSFMQREDIYALFGNALENAIQAVMNLQKPEKRVISTRVFMQAEFLIVQIQNYYDGELVFENGLPQTTKGGGNCHGYGLKSIQYTAEKYGGTMSVDAKDGTFVLQIMFVPPKE